ncbi:ABC transporter permease subunit [Sulfitobacter sp. M57]|uniref:ABC transporter permease subunit n=1 Tax=unclassified Sulfitobacter TaxID=196795 RepID=UPI0023E13A3A|nr:MULTISPECIES: ABC transporter permease subunit [unclassified Sulfitobacter]MDF3416083.1 ABC transporter permease subunit [Sulfitobacter sp. KE5]MDF3423562.1 ABC transporter permease subunit [Sulfitobacter sp. KE43]MDF3434636.1 ABC transporter permease subunit [Sulfitobacter sp. KE42]MDF3460268.1 ABC transporter permease subunit [Sulfitobacter sp. S74]MDF3464174.1 ABC transporter permease subunit [Sulfitobacter sp. Ks18]
MGHTSKFLKITAMFGFIFLYAPIVSLIIFSFNESKLVTVWGGFSTKWYGALFQDPQILQAAWVSLKIAFLSATIAVVIGTIGSFVLIRFKRFRTKSLLSMMITAPLVMPEVIIGLSLLLLFVAMQNLIGWPGGRGMLTIILAHSTFGAAYAAVVIQSRLVDMDLSIEEAAQDLGARPVRVFFDVTLPVIAPALVSGWLLAFTLSLDDLVIASFVSGPGASTLPMVIFSKVRLGVSPDVNALATIIIGLVSLGIIVAALQINRSKKQGADR